MSTEREPLLGDNPPEDHETNEEESVETDDRFQSGRFTTLEKILFATAVGLFIVLCILAGLYTRRIYDTPPHPPKEAPPPPDKANTCLTPECVLTAAQILKDIDTTIDPCEDFYQYTCMFSIKEALRKILSHDFNDFYNRTHSSSSHLPDPEKLVDQQNFEKAKSLYDSCMNEATIDSRGPEPIYPLIRELKELFPVNLQKTAAIDTRKLTQTLSYLAKRSVNTLFNIGVDADPKDPTVNSLQLYQSGLTLPSKVYYTQHETVHALSETIVETLNAVFSKASTEFNWTKFSGNATARLVVEFEKKLANISQLPEELQDPEVIYNPFSLSELTTIAPNVDWGLYINHLLPSDAPHPGRVIVSSPEYLKQLSELLEKENVRTVQAYVIWHAVISYSDALGEDIRKPLRKLQSKLIGTDPRSIKPRWDTCLDEVNSGMGFLVGRYYVIDKFGGEAKSRADDFVNSIKDVFVKRLPELGWIDDTTRERAIDKVNKLIRKVGYPDESPDIMSPVSLSEYYGDLSMEEDDYFGNYMNSRRWSVGEEWRQVGKAPDRSKWYMNPQEVNAYFNPSFNEIVFPAGILQNPFFGNNYPEYLNYGGIGVVVGHELTHGFDNMGRHFDGEGRLVQWWTNETSAQFDEKASCFVKQYSNFTMIDEEGNAINVNGKLTLGENLADNGGLGEAYTAWKGRYDGDEKDKKYNNHILPGLGELSPEQLFFVNFGRIWCHKATPAQAKKSVLTDEHSPPRWRVNGAVQNSKKFSEVFKCPAGSPMNPSHKCELW
ncbi:hypothetical protein BDB01DRAFT_843391 [Pilobolus umbonatus]|nr:hypothetical protein BDB01DRAFT_843391 [Pilobolus umbonatus]